MNESTGDGTGTFSSSTDYSTDYYYDLFAEGWLYFQPDGGAENEVCTNWASVGNQTYVEASCTANVGSAVGYFSLTNAYWPYLGLYMQDLNGGTFTGRYVTEYNSAASDGCWRSPNSGSPVTSLSDRGTWYVGSVLGINSSGTGADYLYRRANAYGYDNLRFYLSSGSQRLYDYVTDMRPSGNACSVTATQSMYMYCTGYTGAGQYYTTGSTIGDIVAASSSAASLTTTRSSVTNLRSYP